MESKKQFQVELLAIEALMQRYGENINLSTAYDNIAVALDFYRGACFGQGKINEDCQI